jgi:hypothetical protein
MLSLHISFRALGLRWPLRDQDDVEVWTSDHILVATVSGELIRNLVQHHLAAAMLGREMDACIRKPLAILPSQRDRRRLQRRSRRQDKLK